MQFTPEQKLAWRAEQRVKPKWQGLYGWSGVPATRPTGEKDIHGNEINEILEFPKFFNRFWSASPRDQVLGSPHRSGDWNERQPRDDKQKARFGRRATECRPTRYLVWGDRSLREVDKLLRTHFANMPLDEQTRLVEAAAEKQQEAA